MDFSAFEGYPRLATLLRMWRRSRNGTLLAQRWGRYLGVRSGHHLLDLGCAGGETSAHFASVVAPAGRVLGIDSNRDLIRAALARHGTNPSLHFLHASGERLPCRDATLDVVWIDRVLSHCADPGQVLREVARVLRPGGRVLVHEYDYAAISLVEDVRAFAAHPEQHAVLQKREGPAPLNTTLRDYLNDIRSPTCGAMVASSLRGLGFDLQCETREVVLCTRALTCLRALALTHWLRTQAADAYTAPAWRQATWAALREFTAAGGGLAVPSATLVATLTLA